jgi:hypothetical protein
MKRAYKKETTHRLGIPLEIQYSMPQQDVLNYLSISLSFITYPCLRRHLREIRVSLNCCLLLLRGNLKFEITGLKINDPDETFA